MMLPDTLKPGLGIVICGTSAGKRSAQTSTYYAGRGNRFWDVLYKSGLSAGVLLKPGDFEMLHDFGIGLTDLAKNVFGTDDTLRRDFFDVERLRTQLLIVKPRVLAFNGKRAASVFQGRPTSRISYGSQNAFVGSTELWVLPSTSGAARAYWCQEPWDQLARQFGQLKGCSENGR